MGEFPSTRCQFGDGVCAARSRECDHFVSVGDLRRQVGSAQAPLDLNDFGYIAWMAVPCRQHGQVAHRSQRVLNYWRAAGTRSVKLLEVAR